MDRVASGFGERTASGLRRKAAPSGRSWLSVPLVIGSVLTASMLPGSAAMAAECGVASLRREMERLRHDYERRIQALEERIAALEAAKVGQGQAGGVAASELEALKAAARRAAGRPQGAEQPSPGAGPPMPSAAATAGHERNLNRLNPEISLTGDVLALAEGPDENLDAREFELNLQSVLDPFSLTKWTMSFEEGEVGVEEGYVTYAGLAGGVSLRAGKMRQTFGALNRFHQHALPQVDYPAVLEAFFEEGGLAQTGVSVEWLVPRPWASANELTVQVTEGTSEPFGGHLLERLAFLAHLKNYWDLSPSTYLEWGLSGIGGRGAEHDQARVWGSDVTVHWQPPARAKYREITWRTEALFSQRDDALGARREAWGGYSYLEGLLRRNLHAGLRYDWVQDPLRPAAERWSVSPYVTWWQSEFVRLRGAYRLARDDAARDTDHLLMLQLTWAAGPHKHESY